MFSNSPLIITIDGPAASGKSSAGREIARLYTLPYVYTGLLFRGLTWALTHKLGFDKAALEAIPVVALKQQLDVLVYTYDHACGCKLFYGDQEITNQLKTPEVDSLAPIVANNRAAREAVMELERKLAQHGAVVDSRDAGALVFPHAQYKFFFTASFEERVKRRSEEWVKAGVVKSVQDAQRHMKERDDSDAMRGYFRLIIPEQVVFIDTTYLSKEQVIDRMIQVIGLP